ncbi:MAG: vWA domain-containing protein [Deltaproteobacteria bacterium]|nr:vWA domain-containing protein [Deltaproteobacteria bacterium]
MTTEAVELVISFDTTGSMYPCLTQLRRSAEGVVKRLFKEIPGLRVGVISHGDYCDGDKMITMMDLTDDEKKVVKFINSAPQTGGGDLPEAYEQALHTARSMNWTAGRNKVVVLIGDDVPHEPNDKQNKDKVDWRNELNLLLEAGVHVYGVHAMPGIRKHSKKFYEQIAKLGGGFYLTLDQFSYITDLVLAVAYKQVSDEQLQKFEEEVVREKRMNKSLNSIFSTMLGREVKVEARVDGLQGVPSGRFQILDVDSDVVIRPFVESQGASFKPGRGFYQLTKSELVQERKEVILQDRASGEFFSGDDARRMIGLEVGERARIKPVFFDKYLVFIQSTSYNRKLIGGTKFLYEVEDWERPV